MAILPKLIQTRTNDVGIATSVGRAKISERRVELSRRIGRVGRVVLGSSEKRFGACVELNVRVERGKESLASGRNVTGDGRDVGDSGLGSNRCKRRTEKEERSCQGASGGGEAERPHCWYRDCRVERERQNVVDECLKFAIRT